MLNSLFNTLAIKREKNYALICKTFETEGVTTEEQIHQCRATMLSNAKTCVAFVLLVGGSLAILFSTLAWFIFIAVGVLVLYMIHSAHQGRQLAQRYLEEVINAPKQDNDENIEAKEGEENV